MLGLLIASLRPIYDPKNSPALCLHSARTADKEYGKENTQIGAEGPGTVTLGFAELHPLNATRNKANVRRMKDERDLIFPASLYPLATHAHWLYACVFVLSCPRIQQTGSQRLQVWWSVPKGALIEFAVS